MSIPPELRREIQNSRESIRVLARRHHISPATVHKWRKRTTTIELPRGPKRGEHLAVPPHIERALILFRQQTLLPLDDCFHALRVSVPTLSRSTLHRYFHRRKLGSLECVDSFRLTRYLNRSAMGTFHLGLMPIMLRNAEALIFTGFDRVSKFAFASIEAATGQASLIYLHKLIDAAPFPIRSVQTSDHHVFVASRRFTKACDAKGIEHLLISMPSIDWGANSQPGMLSASEVVFDTLEEGQAILEERLRDYNTGCKLKSLGGVTPLEFVRERTSGNTVCTGSECRSRVRESTNERIDHERQE